MNLIDLMPVALLGLAAVLLAYVLARDYAHRGPRRPIATDHDHDHHGLIWILLALILLGICGPGARQGPPGPPGPAGPQGPPGRPAPTP